jgi:phage terminase large subunit
MTELVNVSTGYQPRPDQAAIHESLRRFNVLVCHRRFGKTVLAVNHLIDKCMRIERDRVRTHYIAPLYKQAKTVAWDYCKAYGLAIPGSKPNESELRLDFPNGARLQLLGADNPDTLRGIYSDEAVFDEVAQMPRSLWTEVMRPALADREGGALFIGTPAGRNYFWELYEAAKADPDWFAALYKASETDIVPKEELAAAARAMSADQYAQEFECSFEAALPGAYYGRLMREAEEDGRICAVPHDPAAQVQTWWDLGIGDATAIWFAQRVGKEIHLIDYYEQVGEGLAHYAHIIQEKAKRGNWNMDVDVVPHDAEARELGTGKSRVEVMKSLGLNPKVNKRESVGERIEAARNFIPRCWFDESKCARGIEALRQYHQEWDDKRQCYKNNPLHDWTSHAADAFGEGAKFKATKGIQGQIQYPKQHVSQGVI